LVFISDLDEGTECTLNNLLMISTWQEQLTH